MRYLGYRFTLYNQLDEEVEVLVGTSWLRRLNILIFNPEGNKIKELAFGTELPKTYKQPTHIQNFGKIILPPCATRTLEVVIDRHVYGEFISLALHSQQSLEIQFGLSFYERKYHLIFDIFFCGLVFFQLVVMAFQWRIQRRREYVYYTLYLAAIFIYFFQKIERIYELDIFFCYQPEIVEWLNPVSSLLSQFFYLCFGRYFLGISSEQKDIYRIFRFLEISIWIAVVFNVFLLWISDGLFAYQFFGYFSLYLFVGALVLIYKVLRLKTPYAIFILAGSFMAIVGNLLSLLVSLTHINLIDGFWGITYVQIGIVLEILVFNVGLLYKSKIIEKENLEAQQSLIKQLEENEKLNKNMQQIRDKISQDLHDDIGATLSSIKIYSEVAQKQWERFPQKVPQLLAKIQENAGEIMEAMGDIVWTINPKRDKMEDLIFKMTTFANELLSMKQIDFEARISPELYQLRLGMNERKNLFLIFKEAINNAAKYSQAKQVKFDLACEAKCLKMRIQDDGIGFEPEPLHLGNGTTNMRKRAAEIGGSLQILSEKGKGTQIFCEIPNLSELC